MSPLLTISLQTSLSLWIVVPVGIAILVFAAWSYRYTRPPLPRAGRIVLAILRGLALLMVWLLIVQFAVFWQVERPIRTRIAVLVDRSESMSYVDGIGDRDVITRRLIREIEQTGQGGQIDWQWYGFSDRVEKLPGSTLSPAEGAVTDLEQALRHLATRPGQSFDLLLLVSDGAVNRGGPPSSAAQALGVPIYTVAVGDSLPVKDLVFTSLVPPVGGYVGEPKTLSTTFRATGLDGAVSQIRLTSESGEVIESRSIRIEGDWVEHTIDFAVTPGQAGINTWRVEVLPSPGEVDTSNNRRQAVVSVAERRRSVLLLAGVPDPDAATLARALELDDDTELTVVIGDGIRNGAVRGKFEMLSDLSRFDAVIVIATRTWGQNSRQALKRIIDTSMPMMILTGAEPDQAVLRLLGSRIGGELVRAEQAQARAFPSHAHPILTEAGEWYRGPVILPPLDLPSISVRASDVVATSEPNGQGRVLLAQASSPRTLTWVAGGLWRWDLGQRVEDPSGREFGSLLDRILRFLITPESEDQVQLAADQMLLTAGEDAVLTLRVLNAARRPLDEATIRAKVSKGGEEQPIDFRPLGQGRYQAVVAPFGAGHFEAEALVTIGNETHSRSVEYVVDPFNLEAAERRMRPDRLRSLAKVTGGQFLLPEQVEELDRLLPLEEGFEIVQGKWRPFGLWLTLLLIAGLLAAEWLVRTRTGMV